jgi:hypothetical protein
MALMVGTTGQVRADYITGVTVADVSSEGLAWNRQAIHVLDGSGLFGDAHDSGPDQHMWDTTPDDLAPRITFDLGAAYTIQSMHVWNYNAADFNGFTYRERGIQDLTISGSLDGVVYTPLGLFTFAEAPGTDGYLGEDVNTGAFLTRFVRFDVISNYSPDGFAFSVGLSEIRFSESVAAVPEPTAMISCGIGGAMVLGVGWRRRRGKAIA